MMICNEQRILQRAAPVALTALLALPLAALADESVPREGLAGTPATQPKDAEVADSDVTGWIEHRLQQSSAVSLNPIDVTCTDGVVTLEGEVDNLMAHDTAVRTAQTTRGVRAVVDRLAVRASDLPDPTLRRDVVSALAIDPATESWEIDVSVKDGAVTLRGQVDSYAERDLAASVTKRVQGVRDIENEITVLYETERPDDEIEVEVEERLRWDTRVDHEMVDVAVTGGKVILSGHVGSAFERSTARRDAWVAGVDSVDVAGLDVAWWDPPRKRTRPETAVTDEEIREAVETAFLYDPRVLSFKPDVTVDDGVVTLRGTVDSVKAKRAATSDARNTVGVRRVRNLLKVRPETRPDDAELAANVRNALARDPFVERFEITVLVEDGTAHLYGTVDSHFEKYQAEDIAARVNGVVDVHDHLAIDYDANVIYDVDDWDPARYDLGYDRTVLDRSDMEIREDIRDELWWSPFVDADQVNVAVDDGKATLTGTVDSWSERRAATENALEGGALEVDNDLMVK